MSKQFVAVLVAVIVGLGAIFWFTQDKSSAPSSSNSASLSNHVAGQNTKGVNLTEYGDFQCPACYSYEPLTEQIRQKYANEIHFQFRNYPITSKHPNAFAAARAAEAAGKQDKYWQMHDKLYAEQDPNGQTGWVVSKNPLDDYFVKYAEGLSLKIDQFKTDYASSAVNDTINADFAAGQKLGIQGTPSFYLQGKKIEETPRDVDGFSKLIDQAIKDAQSQKKQ